jgi:hypothetical protein
LAARSSTPAHQYESSGMMFWTLLIVLLPLLFGRA